MFNISSFLDKFSKSLKSTELYKEKITEIINTYTKNKISSKDIEIKNNIIYIKSSPSIKNTIFIEKNKILEELSKSNQVKLIDIR